MREGRYTFMKHRMSRLQRAKQFMPFAALKGFETLLATVARPKESRVEGPTRGTKSYNPIIDRREFCASPILQRSLLYGVGGRHRDDK